MSAKVISKMIRRFALVFALICLTSAQVNQQEVRHLILNDANLIETARGFAINAPNLLQNNWKTVSVNGDNVIVTAPNCQQNVLTKQALMGSMELQNLLNTAKRSLYAVESGGQSALRSGSIRLSLIGNSASMNNGRNLGMSSFSSNGVSITKYDEQGMTISKNAGFPDNIARIFITNDVVTYVYQDLRVLMKPTACLQPNEQQLIQQARQEAQEAQRRFEQSMQQFNQNMQNMNQRMQQGMRQSMMHLHDTISSAMNGGAFPSSMGQYQQQMRTYPMQGGAFMSQASNGFHNPQATLLMGTNNNGYLPTQTFGHMMNGGAGAFSGARAGNGMALATAGRNWPYGPDNSPFFGGFPFGR